MRDHNIGSNEGSQHRFFETEPMVDHKIGWVFFREIRKITLELSSLPPLIGGSAADLSRPFLLRPVCPYTKNFYTSISSYVQVYTIFIWL